MLPKLGEEEDSDANSRRYLCDLLVFRNLLWMQPPEPKPRPPIMIEREIKPPIRHQQWNRPIYIIKWEEEHKLNKEKSHRTDKEWNNIFYAHTNAYRATVL